jgi:RNA recognition motif-containing protein
MRKKLYVGNLPWETTEEQIREAFDQFGTITDVHMPKDWESGQFRGFAFVEFSDAQSAADAANALNETDFHGRPLKVNEAKEREPRGGGGQQAGRRGGYSTNPYGDR